jgi:hypothetical protein
MDNIPMRNSALKAIADKRLAQENGVKTGDPIKKTQTVDPDTGAVTYRHTWSGSSESSKSTSNTARRSSPTISSVGSKSAKKEAGSREFTTAPRLAPAGKTEDTKPSASLPSETKLSKSTKTKAETLRALHTPAYNASEEKKSGKSYEEWDAITTQRMKENSKKNKDKESKGVFMLDDPSNNKVCRTC